MENFLEMISINPEIRFGKPCIQGTRIAVEDILGWLASGMSNEEIIEDYPSLNKDQILAALSFAARREQYVRILVS
ncbi:MAG: DUF433 domain-containing protein [Ignavibacteriae bacterium]|nr:DUF433 domain-containing protein [Ignavibacteriota bacterium]